MTDPASDFCCDNARENIPWYVNGTLSDPEATALCEHIRSCGDCQEDLKIHTDMRAAVLGRELTPMIPATKPEQIIGTRGKDINRQSWARQAPVRVIAAAASIAIFGLALVLALYPKKDADVGNQIFQTATSSGSTEGMDYVLQLQFEEGISISEGGRIAAKLDGAFRWTVSDEGVYEVHVRLSGPSLQALQRYEKETEALQGVQSARFTALQLPIR